MLRYVLFLLLSGSALTCCGQQKITYFDKSGNEVTASAAYDHAEAVTRDPDSSNRATVQEFSAKGILRSVTHYGDYVKMIEDGPYEDYYPDGKRHTVGTFRQGKLDGELKTYWENGKLRRDDVFSHDKLLHGKCYDSTGRTVPHTKYRVMPEFPGGETGFIHYLSTSVHYPKDARELGIQGTVVIKFSIQKDGRVTGESVSQHVAPDIDKEALRVVRAMPRWKPGTLDGETVIVRYSLPIRFKLE